jgi:hypothetical protein
MPMALEPKNFFKETGGNGSCETHALYEMPAGT